MKHRINIDLHNDDVVWAWECFYKADNRFIRKIIFSEGKSLIKSNSSVEISIESEKEFNEYIEFFKIPAEQIQRHISD